MTNVIEILPYRSAKNRHVQIAATLERGAVVPFERGHSMAERNNELTAFNRAVVALQDADDRGDMHDAAEWRDELDLLAFHTDSKRLRSRCRAAIKVSQKRAAGRMQ